MVCEHLVASGERTWALLWSEERFLTDQKDREAHDPSNAYKWIRVEGGVHGEVHETSLHKL